MSGIIISSAGLHRPRPRPVQQMSSLQPPPAPVGLKSSLRTRQLPKPVLTSPSKPELLTSCMTAECWHPWVTRSSQGQAEAFGAWVPGICLLSGWAASVPIHRIGGRTPAPVTHNLCHKCLQANAIKQQKLVLSQTWRPAV